MTIREVLNPILMLTKLINSSGNQSSLQFVSGYDVVPVVWIFSMMIANWAQYSVRRLSNYEGSLPSDLLVDQAHGHLAATHHANYR